MRKCLFFLCIFFLFFTFSFLYLDAQTTVKFKKVIIYADKGWQDTGIHLKSQQYYEIRAKGVWQSGYDGPLVGPEGIGFGTIDSDALVGYISKTRPSKLDYDSYGKKDIINHVIMIGEGGLFKAYGGGATLWLAMGDWSGCEECTGYVEVLITIYD